MKKLNVAIIGYGRSGCDIHGAFLRTPENDICNVVAVVENDPARAEAAKKDFGCDTYHSYTELFDRTDLDFVVNASYQTCITLLQKICWSMASMFCARNLCARHRRWCRI